MVLIQNSPSTTIAIGSQLIHIATGVKEQESIWRLQQVLAILECARNKANEARIEAERASNDVKRGNLLAKVKIALDEGVLSKDEVAETVKYVDLEEGQQLLVRGDWSVISIDEYDIALVTDGRSFGRTPVKNHDTSWMCPRCRSYGPWSGNMCLSCGMKSC